MYTSVNGHHYSRWPKLSSTVYLNRGWWTARHLVNVYSWMNLRRKARRQTRRRTTKNWSRGGDTGKHTGRSISMKNKRGGCQWTLQKAELMEEKGKEEKRPMSHCCRSLSPYMEVVFSLCVCARANERVIKRARVKIKYVFIFVICMTGFQTLSGI